MNTCPLVNIKTIFLPEEIVSVKSSVDKLDDLECTELPALVEELDDERERFFLSDIYERSSNSFLFELSERKAQIF